MNTTPKLLVTLEGGVKRITFNRPERRNPIDFETFELLRDAVLACATDGTRVVVLTGAGDSFCSGADLVTPEVAGDAAFALDVAAHLREHTTPAVLGLRDLSVPVIARVHGACVGIGFSYALASDIVIASEQASFGMGFVRVGLMPDGGSTELLPRAVGYHKAFELMATGEQIDAREAMRLGVVNRVVPLEDLDATINQLAARFADSPQPALANIKRALNRAGRAELAAALEFEAVNQHECFHSPDFREGVAAFREKRRPVWGQGAGKD